MPHSAPPHSVALSGHPPAPRGLRILSVFPDTERRVQLRALCLQMAPGSHCLESASVTDAVLALLSGPVDLVLVDVPWAGDLLPGLVMHMRRSAPRAALVGFCHPPPPGAPPRQTTLPLAVHAWDQMPQVLQRWWQGVAPAQTAAAGTGSGAGR